MVRSQSFMAEGEIAGALRSDSAAIPAESQAPSNDFSLQEKQSLMRPKRPERPKRIEAIDFVRGIAVMLMILSHGVVGLVSLNEFPSWGLVPIHLITKVSSSLFILVFGIGLAFFYLPKVGTERWPKLRTKLLLKGLSIFFWYKILVLVEMIPQYSREDVLATLLYQAFPVYVEILGFYALALIWVPLILPLWKKAPIFIQFLIPPLVAWLAHSLYENFHFWGNVSLQAILVEHPDHYTWGQLARAPLIFVGLLLGQYMHHLYWRKKAKAVLGLGLLSLAGLMGAGFIWLSLPAVGDALYSVARNEGKHPPELAFMLFSLSGAMIVLSIMLFMGESLARILRPITIIGTNALQAFIFHIFVLFVFYRYLFDYWRNVEYEFALKLAILLIAMTAVWIKTLEWVQKKSSASS